jgi:glycosyltransferase involved in cell wall biosynthesis
MIIDMFSTGASGSGVAALRLHQGLLAQGVSSRLWHKPARRQTATAGRPTAVEPLALRGQTNWRDRWRAIRRKLRTKRALRGRPADLEIFTSPATGAPTPYDALPMTGNILHLHWINRWLDWPSFFSSIPDAMPIVWTLHDMNPITGGCHHADGCTAFHSRCGNCPQLAQPHRGIHDIARQGFDVKLQSYANKNLHIVTPSRWLQQHARSSRLMENATVQTIYNGLDARKFRPLDKRQARRELGLPSDKTIIAFGAASQKNRRKGMPEFFQAISSLENRANLLCLGFGERADLSGQDGLPEVHATGYLNTPEQMARVYSAADLYVMPSLGENMPQTVIESMACGTPVVAFRVGGIPEVVIPGQTGLLAELSDCADLAAQVQWMIDRPHERQEMGARGRQRIEADFDLEQQTGKYIRLYESLHKRSAGTGAASSHPDLRKSA